MSKCKCSESLHEIISAALSDTGFIHKINLTFDQSLLDALFDFAPGEVVLISGLGYYKIFPAATFTEWCAGVEVLESGYQVKKICSDFN